MGASSEKRKRTTRAVALAVAIAILACLLATVPQRQAQAEEAGSLTIWSEGEGATYRVYLLTEIAGDDGEMRVGLDDSATVRLPDSSERASAWQEAARELEAQAGTATAEPTASGVTDGGIVRFDGLTPGFYLVLGDRWSDGESTFTPLPALVRVSGEGAAVYAKQEPSETDEPPEPSTPVTPEEPGGEERPGSDLSRTGDAGWPAALIGVAACSLAALGLLTLRKGNGSR